MFICRVRGVVVDETDEICKLKVDRILMHQNLPNCRSSNNRHNRGNDKELWLVEGKPKLIDLECIDRHVVVWLCDLPEPAEYEFYIREILYRFGSRWKYRDISKRHRLPCEYIIPNPSPQNMPVLKIFLDIYVDDFGTYRNVYHSLGGVYLQFGNMPLSFRKLLKNSFLIGFVPFGAKFDDFIKPVIEDIRRLESGFVMRTLYGNAWVIGGLGCVTADLPQGNDLAGVKRHGATHGCRTCNVTSNQLTNPNYDYVGNARFHQITEQQFLEIENQRTKTTREQLATEYGLVVSRGSFNVLKWDRHIQTPQDAYHSMAGKARTLLEATFRILNVNGEKAFIEYWKNIEKPNHWSRMPNPLRHRQSFMFSDVLRLAMLMPFIIRRFLKPCHIKADVLNKWHTNNRITQTTAISRLCIVWSIEANALKIAFSTTMTESIYQELSRSLEREREILLQVSFYLIN